MTKRFGTKCAVDRLDLEVRAGELFAFLGPNGAGKTTTIKMICGLLAPTAGTVRVGGFDASSQQARQLLGYVPDQPYLYDKLTGREFLRFVVEMYGLEPRRAAERIDELIETFEMGDYVDELCENYSQGMKQRVVFASALVHDPKVLVVDEPLVGLDPRSARIVKDLFISPGPIRLCRADVDPPAGDRRGAGRPDRDRRPRPDAGDGHARPAPRAGPASRAARRPVPETDRRPSPAGQRRRLPGTGRVSNHEPRSHRIPTRSPLPPITADQTARAFAQLRWRLTRNTVRSLLAGSRLRLSMILFCSVVFWVGLFGLFLGGFEFIGLYDELFNAIFEYLFSMFFLSISVMLFFSTGIITYTALFHSREAPSC